MIRAPVFGYVACINMSASFTSVSVESDLEQGNGQLDSRAGGAQRAHRRGDRPRIDLQLLDDVRQAHIALRDWLQESA